MIEAMQSNYFVAQEQLGQYKDLVNIQSNIIIEKDKEIEHEKEKKNMYFISSAILTVITILALIF